MKLAIEEALLVVIFGKPTEYIYQRAENGDTDAQARAALYSQSCAVLIPEYTALLDEIKKELA